MKPHSAHSQPQAFTLIELIIGMTVLTIVMIAVGLLTITAIRANQANINNLTAYYLAQEGVEGLRNMRDSNWMQNHGWNIGGETHSPQLNSLSGFWGDDFGKEGFYTISYNPDTEISFSPTAASPWTLTLLEETDCSTNPTIAEFKGGLVSKLSLFQNDDTTLLPSDDVIDDTALSVQDGFYFHEDTSPSIGGGRTLTPLFGNDAEASKFSRYLLICYPDTGEDILEVTSVVFWEDRGMDHSVEVSSKLSDWREGPL